MIAKGDCIVSVTYFQRVWGHDHSRQETFTMVGQPDSIAAKVADMVERRLKEGTAGPITVTCTPPYNVIDADR